MKRKKVVRFLSCLSILFFIGIIVGCAIMPHRGEVGKPIKDDLISRIQPGKTTREEIIQWFGIPTAVAKKGEKIVLPYAFASPMQAVRQPLIFYRRKYRQQKKLILC